MSDIRIPYWQSRGRGGVRNTGVLGITPFLSNGNRFTLSSQLLLGIVRDFL
jgi:hypothetical protein